MTLSDLQVHSPIVNLFNWDFSYSCAAGDKISTCIACGALPLQQLSFLFSQSLFQFISTVEFCVVLHCCPK